MDCYLENCREIERGSGANIVVIWLIFNEIHNL